MQIPSITPDEETSAPSWLLALPDPCLLAVLQCCAAKDQRSLFSAARAHSRLQQAAALALSSITAVVAQQQQADSLLVYVSKHCQHVDSIRIEKRYLGGPILIEPLLTKEVQLRSLYLYGVTLQPSISLQDVLGGAGLAALKQLQLYCCKLHGTVSPVALAGALWQLPAGLEHLSFSSYQLNRQRPLQFPTGVLQQLQQLTYLELADADLLSPDAQSPTLQPLQALTRLVHLRLVFGNIRITASMLSGARLLTYLDLSIVQLEPAVLAGKTRLQHLQIAYCKLGAAAQAEQLLLHLQQLQQLTHLVLTGTLMEDVRMNTPPAAAYAALTASSRLQYLNISQCRQPAAAWQHIFPAGRQLPHLRELDISDVKQPARPATHASLGVPPEGSQLVSCCPRLQTVSMHDMSYSAQMLAQLQGLSRLHTLHLSPWKPAEEDAAHGICQLTGLRELIVAIPKQRLLLQMAQLKQLTTLKCYAKDSGPISQLSLSSKAPGDEPVWRQLLRSLLDSSDLEMAQQAAAALAE